MVPKNVIKATKAPFYQNNSQFDVFTDIIEILSQRLSILHTELEEFEIPRSHTPLPQNLQFD